MLSPFEWWCRNFILPDICKPCLFVFLRNLFYLTLFLNANLVAQVLGVSPSSGYELMHEPGFPVLRVGSRMVVPKEQFIRWVTEHTEGGGRG